MKRWSLLVALALTACNKPPAASAPEPVRHHILLVTLDTTRADAIGAGTPSFNALASRGRRFTNAYATVPQTLPSHASMFTGLYPAGHGVHENGRFLDRRQPLVAERLQQAGYRTGAFVSAFALDRRFGLARGFDTYDDATGAGSAERSSRETTDRAVAWLKQSGSQPAFLWVHYYDPHYPYAPPEPFRSRYSSDPYAGEVAAMDEQLGRLLQAFEQSTSGPKAIIVAADHGEGLGEHGEAQHGNLLYQTTMHVPLVIAGPGVSPATTTEAVSIRRIAHTILDWAGLSSELSLRGSSREVVAGESMIPFLQYGWQPQVMAVEGQQKIIQAGGTEVYDVRADPGESRDLSASATLSREVRKTIREYPLPSMSAPPVSTALSEEEQRQLAALGYIASDARPVIRKDAPRPAAMAHLFETLDRASNLFVDEKYGAAVPLFEQILAADPHNLMAALRLAAAHSLLGHERAALDAFRRAEAIAPESPDVRNYLALHYVRTNDWERAGPLLERVVAESPERVPALEALATLRERQRRFVDALQLRQKVASLAAPSPADLVRIGELAMEVGQTAVAIDAFEKARAQQGSAFRHDLELGVLYLSQRRLEDARAALDRVAPRDPRYAMALFKRAQVSVLLGEADRAARIALARRHSDATTRELIANERLFR